MSKIRVLLADDHAIVRAGIRHALEELPDLEIAGEVGDGPTLFSALEQVRPECLLIDDSQANIDAAKKLGFATVHFASPDKLQTELQRLNLL